MTPTILDAILVAVMLVSALLAMVRGFSREILSVASWGIAAVVAFLFYKPVQPYVAEYVSSETVSTIAAGLIVFVVTLIVVSFITLKIADFIIDSRIGAFDRVLGFIFGAARGLLLVVVAMVFFNFLAPENQPEWVANAQSKPMLDNLGQELVAALPDNPDQMLGWVGDTVGVDLTTSDPQAETGAAGEPAEAGEPQTIDGVIENAE